MSKVTGGESNLLGGVSQQPVDRRLRGSVSEQVNCLTSILGGIERRPPMKFIPVPVPAVIYDHSLWLNFTLSDNIYVLRVQYTQGSATDLQMDIYEETGVVTPITIDPLIIPYLTDQEPEKINITATNDGIYILNPNKVTEMSALTTLPPYGAYVNMTGTNFGRDYKILIDDIVKSSVSIPADTSGLDPVDIQSESIMAQLDANFNDLNYTTSLSGATMFIAPTDIYTYMNLQVHDGDNNNYLQLAQRVIPSVDKLPAAAIQGTILTVRPNDGGKESEYYLKYTDKQELYDNELGITPPTPPTEEFETTHVTGAHKFTYTTSTSNDARGYATTVHDHNLTMTPDNFLDGVITDWFVYTASNQQDPSFGEQGMRLIHTGVTEVLPSQIEVELDGKLYILSKDSETSYTSTTDLSGSDPYAYMMFIGNNGSLVMSIRNVVTPDFANMYPGGIWIEAVQPGLTYRINKDTMPIKVTFDAALSAWDAASVDWEDRRVGNEENNKTPSFIGERINSMAFIQSRLCFLTDHTVIFSRVDEETDFWKRSATTVTAADRIDIKSRLLDTGAFRTLTAHDKDIVIFGDDEQWVIPIINGLTASGVSLQLASRYSNDGRTPPVALGASLAYPVFDGTYTQIREFYTRDDTGSNDSEYLTSIVPTYIKGRVKQIISTTLNNLLVVQTDEPNTLYVMQWHVQNGAKVMQSWHTWKLPDTPEHMFFVEGLLVIIDTIGMTTGYYTMDPVMRTYNDLDYELHLDYRIELPMGSNNQISLLPNHAYTEVDTLVIGSANTAYAGMSIPFTIDGDTLTVDDKLGTVLSGSWVIGNTYDSAVTLNEIVHRDDQDRYDSSRTLRLNNVKVRHNNSGPYTVNITRAWGDHFSEVYSQSLSRSVAEASLGTSLIHSGELTVPVRERSEYVTIEVVSSGHLPFNLTGYDWQGQLNGSGQRRYF
jgi:hypothetical protein